MCVFVVAKISFCANKVGFGERKNGFQGPPASSDSLVLAALNYFKSVALCTQVEKAKSLDDIYL